MKNFRVLVIDDSKVVCNLIQSMVETSFEVECIYQTDPTLLSPEGLSNVDIVILDYYFGSITESDQNNGLKYMNDLKRINPSIAIIAFSGQKKISKALEMVSKGAIDYVDKNDENFIDNLLQSIQKIIDFKSSDYTIQSTKDNFNNDKGQFLIILIIGLMLLSASIFF